MVNVVAQLWIKPVLSTRSNVYAQHKAVGCHCICWVSKLDKNRGCCKNDVFAQSVPVDIQMLIHSGYEPPKCPFFDIAGAVTMSYLSAVKQPTATLLTRSSSA